MQMKLNNMNVFNDTYLKTCNLYDFDVSQSKNFKNSQFEIFRNFPKFF